MKENEKKGIIISAIITIMGLVGLIYTSTIKDSLEDSGSMYSLGFTYLIFGILLIIYFIQLSKNKKRSTEQENIYEDERLNINKGKASSITFSIIIGTSILAEFMFTFFFREFHELANTLTEFTSFSILVYLIVYYFVSKKN